jgi:hypothetical protein
LGTFVAQPDVVRGDDSLVDMPATAAQPDSFIDSCDEVTDCPRQVAQS